MKRLLVLAVAAFTLAGCAVMHKNEQNPYEKPPFYSRYLNPANPLDQQIQRTVDALRANPRSAPLHNELGSLLAQKGFPKDAEREFERAVDADRRFYPAWYNLGLMRAARGNYAGAGVAFHRTIHYKPGHAAALFQLGLLEERRENSRRAVHYYAKAFQINRGLLDVRVNPRILDSKLVHLALIEAYPNEHTRQSLQFQPTPADYRQPEELREAPSPPPPAQKISPAPPTQTPPRKPPV